MAEFRYSLRGEVDFSVATKVRKDLQVIVIASDAHLLVDCTHLTSIDSYGIAILLEANRDLEQQGRHMLIANVPPRQRNAFELLGISDLLRFDRQSTSNVVYLRNAR